MPIDIQKRLATEYRFVARKIREESVPIRRVYFFSALFTEISRILNWHWDRDLVLLHWALQQTHSQLSARVQSPPPTSNPEFVAQLLESLDQVADDLAVYMEQGGKSPKLYNILGRIAEIGYLSTQHGSYVLEKELVKIDNATSSEQPS